MTEEIGVCLREDFGVKAVMIGELWTQRLPRNVSPDTYEERRENANSYLGTLLEAHEHVHFWQHRRVFQAQTDIFAADGVHLNAFGQQRFYCSLRLVITTAIKNL